MQSRFHRSVVSSWSGKIIWSMIPMSLLRHSLLLILTQTLDVLGREFPPPGSLATWKKYGLGVVLSPECDCDDDEPCAQIWFPQQRQVRTFNLDAAESFLFERKAEVGVVPRDKAKEDDRGGRDDLRCVSGIQKRWFLSREEQEKRDRAAQDAGMIIEVSSCGSWSRSRMKKFSLSIGKFLCAAVCRTTTIFLSGYVV